MQIGKYTLRHNQVALYEFLQGRDMALIDHKMRAGKTLPTSMVVAELVAKHGLTALIVAPPKVIPTWKQTLKDINADMTKISVLSSGQLSVQRLLDFKQEYANVPVDILVLDEIHMYRAFSLRFKCANFLASKASYRFGLTGTLFDKDLYEFFYPLMLLDRGALLGTNKEDVKAFMCDVCIHSGKVTMRPEKAAELMVEVRKFSHFYSAPEVKAPDEEFHKYELTQIQKSWVRRLVHTLPIPEIMNEHSDLGKAHINSKVLQVLSGFYLRKNGDALSLGVSQKWLTLFSLVNKLGGKGIVVWVQFVKEYEYCFAALNAFKVARYTEKNLRAFRAGEIDILVLHPASVGVGVDISCASHAVFVNHTASGIDNAQAYYRLSMFEGEGTKTVHHLVPNEKTAIERVKTIREKIARIREFSEENCFSKK